MVDVQGRIVGVGEHDVLVPFRCIFRVGDVFVELLWKHILVNEEGHLIVRILVHDIDFGWLEIATRHKHQIAAFDDDFGFELAHGSTNATNAWLDRSLTVTNDPYAPVTEHVRYNGVFLAVAGIRKLTVFYRPRAALLSIANAALIHFTAGTQ